MKYIITDEKLLDRLFKVGDTVQPTIEFLQESRRLFGESAEYKHTFKKQISKIYPATMTGCGMTPPLIEFEDGTQIAACHLEIIL